MKFAIIADIHANLDAFQVVLADIKEQNCTHYACVGDVVGYGPNPRECLKIVRDLGCRRERNTTSIARSTSNWTGLIRMRRRR